MWDSLSYFGRFLFVVAVSLVLFIPFAIWLGGWVPGIFFLLVESVNFCK